MWARIQNGVAVELTEVDPAGRFVPSLVWVEAPDGTGVGWAYDGAAFQPPAPPAAPPPVVQVSPLDFMARFTATETGAIAVAAQTNAAMLLWLVQASAASYIDLTDPRTKAGLDALVAAGLLTAARATEILTP